MTDIPTFGRLADVQQVNLRNFKDVSSTLVTRWWQLKYFLFSTLFGVRILKFIKSTFKSTWFHTLDFLFHHRVVSPPLLQGFQWQMKAVFLGYPQGDSFPVETPPLCSVLRKFPETSVLHWNLGSNIFCLAVETKVEGVSLQFI